MIPPFSLCGVLYYMTAIRLHGSYSTGISVSLSNKKESAPVKLILSHVLVADEHVERRG